MSDPAVYNDHREAADAGRRLKELEGPYKLAQQWRSAQEDLLATREDPELASLAPDPAEIARLEEELKLALVEADPADRKDVIVEVRQGVGGDEAGLWAADVYRMLTRYAERRGFSSEQLSASPLDGDGGRHAGGRGGRGGDRPERPQDRRLPLDWTGRAERQHDRLGRPDHPPPDESRRLDAGREVPDPEPGEGPPHPAREAVRARAGEAAGRARERPAVSDRERRAGGEDPHLQLPGEPRYGSPGQADRAPARIGARRRAGRVHRRAGRRGAAPGAGCRRSELLIRGQDLSPEELDRFRALVARRASREPLAYILGEWGFRRLTLVVDPRVLIPRPETESVVDRCLDLLRDVEAPTVLDIGAGSGAIALALADERPDVRIVATDVSSAALEVAEENRRRASLNGRVRFVHGDLLAGEEGPFHLVVGDGQAGDIAARLRELGFREVRVSEDLAGRERVVEGRRP